MAWPFLDSLLTKQIQRSNWWGSLSIYGGKMSLKGHNLNINEVFVSTNEILSYCLLVLCVHGLWHRQWKMSLYRRTPTFNNANMKITPTGGSIQSVKNLYVFAIRTTPCQQIKPLNYIWKHWIFAVIVTGSNECIMPASDLRVTFSDILIDFTSMISI